MCAFIWWCMQTNFGAFPPGFHLRVVHIHVQLGHRRILVEPFGKGKLQFHSSPPQRSIYALPMQRRDSALSTPWASKTFVYTYQMQHAQTSLSVLWILALQKGSGRTTLYSHQGSSSEYSYPALVCFQTRYSCASSVIVRQCYFLLIVSSVCPLVLSFNALSLVFVFSVCPSIHPELEHSPTYTSQKRHYCRF